MANPCFYTYKGKKYTYEEFATLLHDGELANLVKNSIVQGDFVNSMPEELKVTVNEKKENGDIVANANVSVGTEQIGEVGIEKKPKATVIEEKSMESTVERGASKNDVEVKTSINDAVKDNKDVYFLDGERGNVKLDGQTVIFETNDKIIELGNKEDLKDASLDDFGITKEKELDISLNDDNSVNVKGVKYNNNYSNPESAFTQDKDGNYSVSLETDNGQKRTFRGQVAEQIVYQTKLKNFEQNANEQQIEKGHELADEIIRTETEATKSSVKRENKTVRQAKPKVVEVTPTVEDVVEKPTVQKQPTRQEKIVEKKKLADAKIDDIANALKDLLPKGFDPEGLKKNGFSQDDLIDIVAKGAKALVNTGIEIDEAIRQVISKLKEHFEDFNIDEKAVMEKHFPKEEAKEKAKEKVKEKVKEGNFEKNASFIPNSGEVGQYLSGETIQKYTGEEPTNDQTIQKVKLQEALLHGVNNIELAKEQFGDNFVSETLDFVKNSNIPIEAKSLTLISLENEINKQKLLFPERKLELQKQLDLIRKERQAFASANSLALNMNRLQAFAKIGYDINEITDKLFSSEQKSSRDKIEKSIEANAEEINSEAEKRESGETIVEDLDKEIKSNSKKAKEVANKIRQYKIHKPDIFSSASPASLAWDSAVEIVAKSVEAGGSIADSIQKGIDYIKSTDWYKSLSDDKKQQAENGLKDHVEKALKPKDKKTQEIVKQALIDAGYSREVKVKGEIKTYLDWKKLAGEESSIPKLKKTVEKVLKSQGYSEAKISEMSDALENEYNDLRASIIEKSIRELQNRNKIKPEINIKAVSRKLAELYNYGLFDEKMETYNRVLNSALGFDEFKQKEFEELADYGKALANLYGFENPLNNNKKLSELAIKTQASIINHEVKRVLSKSAFRESNKAFKIASVIRDYTGLAQRSKLLSVKQLIENPLSGFIERQYQNLGDIFNVKENGDIKANRKKLAKYVYEDIVTNGALFYGETSTTLTNQTKVEDWLNKKSDNELYHLVLSGIFGRSYLEGADSMNKALITEKNFTYNIIKLLTSDSNPNGKMSKDEAMQYVAEHTTGQKFDEAMDIASKFIEQTNKKIGKEVLPNTKMNQYRFAMDIVKESLANGGKITLEQVEKAYKAGYKSAGFSIGHEANNVISSIVGGANARIEQKLETAIKDKKWDVATKWALTSILSRNVINPFVGGGMNWAVLTLQKAGLDPISIFTDYAEKKNNPIDLSSPEGIKNLEKALMRSTNYRNTATRTVIGAGVSILMASLAVSTGADDSLDSWLKKNKWARRYFNVIAPPSMILLLSLENDELGKYLQTLLNVKVDQFDNTVKFIKSVDSKNKSTTGVAGQIVGQPLDTPIPWRMVKDIDEIRRGLNGLPPTKYKFSATDFLNGYYQGGLVEYMGLRPNAEILEEKVEKQKMPSLPKMPELPKLP